MRNLFRKKPKVEIKFFEIQDRTEIIPAVAIKLDSLTDKEWELLLQTDHGEVTYSKKDCIVLHPLYKDSSKYNLIQWNNRTSHIAYVWIKIEWDNLESGAVLDTQFILEHYKTSKFYPERNTKWI